MFRRPGMAGGPPGHPARDPGGWLRADQGPAWRPSRTPPAEPVRLLAWRPPDSRPGPAGGYQRHECGRHRRPAGQIPRLRSTVSAALTHLRHRPMGGQDAADRAQQKLVVLAAGPGGEGKRASHHPKRAAGRSRYTRPVTRPLGSRARRASIVPVPRQRSVTGPARPRAPYGRRDQRANVPPPHSKTAPGRPGGGISASTSAVQPAGRATAPCVRCRSRSRSRSSEHS